MLLSVDFRHKILIGQEKWKKIKCVRILLQSIVYCVTTWKMYNAAPILYRFYKMYIIGANIFGFLNDIQWTCRGCGGLGITVASKQWKFGNYFDIQKCLYLPTFIVQTPNILYYALIHSENQLSTRSYHLQPSSFLLLELPPISAKEKQWCRWLLCRSVK